MRKNLANYIGRMLRFGSMALTLPTVAVVLAIAPATSASASVRQAGPLFTCPNPAVCIFQYSNYTGLHETFTPSSSHGHWIFLEDGTFPPSGTGVPQSVNDNSGSAVEFYSTGDNVYRCVPPHTKEGLVAHPFDYLYIAYGASNCGGIPPF